jgi:hypothetical protein
VHHEDYNCVLCTTQDEETLLHLFFQCSFSKWCWRFLDIEWNTALRCDANNSEKKLQLQNFQGSAHYSYMDDLVPLYFISQQMEEHYTC